MKVFAFYSRVNFLFFGKETITKRITQEKEEQFGHLAEFRSVIWRKPHFNINSIKKNYWPIRIQ